MPPDELVRDGIDDRVDVEAACFLAKMSMKHDVKKKITQFFGHPFEITVFDCFEDLVNLLDQHGFERVEVLLLVPWTAVGTAQFLHNADQPLEFFSSAPGCT